MILCLIKGQWKNHLPTTITSTTMRTRRTAKIALSPLVSLSNPPLFLSPLADNPQNFFYPPKIASQSAFIANITPKNDPLALATRPNTIIK